jgi:hypothetical protein
MSMNIHLMQMLYMVATNDHKLREGVDMRRGEVAAKGDDYG